MEKFQKIHYLNYVKRGIVSFVVSVYIDMFKSLTFLTVIYTSQADNAEVFVCPFGLRLVTHVRHFSRHRQLFVPGI